MVYIMLAQNMLDEFIFTYPLPVINHDKDRSAKVQRPLDLGLTLNFHTKEHIK